MILEQRRLFDNNTRRIQTYLEEWRKNAAAQARVAFSRSIRLERDAFGDKSFYSLLAKMKVIDPDGRLRTRPLR